MKELIQKVHPKGVPESVAIVAMGNSSGSYTRVACSFGTNRRVANEVWAINAVAGVILHDLCFQMDDCRVQEARAKRKPEHTVAGTLSWLKDHPKFFTSKVYPEYPGAIAFPLQEVVDDLDTHYLNSTVAFAVAWAIVIKVQKIALFGCDFSYDHLHKSESGRGCVEFLLGKATERGIKIIAPPETTLLDQNVPFENRIYGYDAYDMSLKDGRIVMDEREVLPTPEEIEKRYKLE